MSETISVIIPTLNEAQNVAELVPYLRRHGGKRLQEIVVSDAGSTDDTVAVATAAGARAVVAPRPGRGPQMNYGAELTTGDVLYFVHADARPPRTFARDIDKARRADYPIGCYRFRFDSAKPLLRVNAYFTRFDRRMFRGGDQTLFVTRRLFERLGGYREDYLIMEDYEFIERARKLVPFRIIPKDVLVSARKYETNSYARVNLANLAVFTMYRAGLPQRALVRTYQYLLDYR